MNDAPLITTIIPTYKRPYFLKAAIESVLNQTFSHFQVCVLDNASGDETFDIVQELQTQDDRIHYHCHSENIGTAANFQYGLQNVKTPFFSFLSDDDMLLPTFYEQALKGFELYEDIAFFMGRTVVVDEKDKIIDYSCCQWKRFGYFVPEEIYAQAAKTITNFYWTSIVFRTDKVLKVGSLDERIQPFDTDYLLRVLSLFPFFVSKQLCAIFRSHRFSSTFQDQLTLDFFSPSWKCMIEKQKNHTPLVSQHNDKAFAYLKSQGVRFLFSVGANSISRKDFLETVRVIRVLQEDFNERKLSNLLHIFLVLSKRFSFFSKILIRLLLIRRTLKRIRKGIKILSLKRKLKKLLEKRYDNLFYKDKISQGNLFNF